MIKLSGLTLLLALAFLLAIATDGTGFFGFALLAGLVGLFGIFVALCREFRSSLQ